MKNFVLCFSVLFCLSISSNADAGWVKFRNKFIKKPIEKVVPKKVVVVYKETLEKNVVKPAINAVGEMGGVVLSGANIIVGGTVVTISKVKDVDLQSVAKKLKLNPLQTKELINWFPEEGVVMNTADDETNEEEESGLFEAFICWLFGCGEKDEKKIKNAKYKGNWVPYGNFAQISTYCRQVWACDCGSSIGDGKGPKLSGTKKITVSGTCLSGGGAVDSCNHCTAETIEPTEPCECRLE